MHTRDCCYYFTAKMATWIRDQFLRVLFLALSTDCLPLNKYISYYEPLVNPSVPYIHADPKLNFEAFGREFRLLLVSGSRVFDSTTKLTIHGANDIEVLASDIDRYLVKGHVKTERNSSVRGYISDGTFSGVINLPEDTYYVEPAREYLNESEISFKSVIYRLSDVNLSVLPCEDDHLSCTLSNVEGFEYLHMASDNTKLKVSDVAVGENTTKSDVTVAEDDGKRGGNICTLRVVVDHVYYQKVSSHTFDTIIAKLIVIFEGVDRIYRRADFDMDGFPDEIGIKISEIVIWWSRDQPGYKLSDESLSNVDFLKLLAVDDMSDVCLGFAITARKFGNSIGLAASRQTNAGICAKKPRRGMRMNVAMATLYLENQQLPNSVAEIVIAHEIGHSFGSGHDPSSVGPCSPTDADGGAYLMSANVAYSRLPNNDVFSSCSLQNISKLMKTLGTECFVKENIVKSCGNGIVDSPTEDCDCGHRAQCDLVDFCCTPQGGLYADKECEYRKSNGAQCSFRQDACCTPKCQIVPATNYQNCNEKDECKVASYCDGVSKDCPPSDNKPDGNECREGLGKCQNGVCQETICQNASLTACECPEWKDDCQLCCLYRGWCIQASILGITMESGLPYSKPDGERCISGRGICIRRKCQELGRILLTGKDPGNESGMSTSTEQTLAVIVFVIALNMGLFLMAILLYCVYKQFRPIQRRHEKSTWAEQIRLRRRRGAERATQ